ncbi:MAG: hypothetical protein KAT66_00685 [Candidatus Lokiarchaeota archaeon]|nr:hypothetical protein [Candidatus Lokiarchaeota archaeon]
MCKWGNTKPLKINGKLRDIDSCIFDLVKLLNENYKTTIACCCGHGKQPTSIVFEDESEIRIMSFEQARKVDELFPPIN